MRGLQEEKRPKINIIREVILYLALKGFWITVMCTTKGHSEFDFGSCSDAMPEVVVQRSVTW